MWLELPQEVREIHSKHLRYQPNDARGGNSHHEGEHLLLQLSSAEVTRNVLCLIYGFTQVCVSEWKVTRLVPGSCGWQPVQGLSQFVKRSGGAKTWELF